MTNPKVLLVQPLLRTPGGSYGLVAWTLQALQDDHDVTLLTWEPVDFPTVNRYFGTAIDPARLRLQLASRWLRALVPDGWTLLKHNVLLRRCKHIRSSYDVVMDGHNEADLGGPGIQYIHYPCFDDPRVNADSMREEDFTHLGWQHRSHAIMRAYFALCAKVSGFTMEGVRRNLTLVNSDWTGRLVKAILAVEPRTVYPPVHAAFPRISWQERELGFVCVGRIAPEKRVDRIIRILAEVRRKGWDVHLHIIGDTADDPRYYALIKPLVETNRSWISVEENLSHEQLRTLIARHRYGIHGMDREHFGIAVAEMVKAGCIVFAPNSGGQVEIVGNDDRLVYDSDEQAVEKISAALGDASLQGALVEHLAGCANRFSADRFVREIRKIIGELAEQGGKR
jgi:glycosyltransferase involved in cell wall biosynthesis